MRNLFARMLALVLCLSILIPVNAQASEKDPQVLRVKNSKLYDEWYAYDEAGNCVLETRIYKSGVKEDTSYTYNHYGTLVEKFSYRDSDIQEAVLYDDFGNLVEHWQYISNDEANHWRGEPEYDEYGRLTWYTKTGPYSMDGELADSYEVESIRYEYRDEPETLLFCHYEQDGNTGNGPEPIEWQILDTDGEQMLLVSRYALDSRVYHSQSANIDWKDCDLREWMSETFVNQAFTESEQSQLRCTKLDKKVNDAVFLLSLEEVKQYFPQEEDRLCTATKYAVKQGAYVNSKTGGSWWLLRSSGTESQCVMSVNSDGSIDYAGGKVDSKKGTVRPAVWVSVTVMADNAQPARKHLSTNTYEGSSKEPVSSRGSLLTYNDQGVLIGEQIRGTDSTGATFMQEYEYDDFGNLEFSVDSTLSGDNEDTKVRMYANTYDKAGQLLKQVQYFGDQDYGTVQYRYDKAGRKIWEKTDDVVESWKYDRYGNLLQYSRNGKIQEAYTYIYAPLSKALWEY